MAEDSSHLRAQIAFLTKLIKSHKELTLDSKKPNTLRSHKSVSNNQPVFSWQRKSQPNIGKKTPSVSLPQSNSSFQSQKVAKTAWSAMKSSYSLDRRKQISKNPGSDITRKSSGISGSSQTLNFPTKTFTPVPCITNTKPGDAPTAVATKPTVSSGIPLSVKSSSTSVVHPSSSSIKAGESKSFSRNPYILNKSNIPSVSGTKPVAQKSELRWTRPSSSRNEDVTSHSDSELYNKRSSHSTAKNMSSLFFTKENASGVLQGKVPPSSNVQLSSYKWLRAEPNFTSNGAVNKWRKAKVPGWRPQRTHPKPHQIGLGQHTNPYVLKNSSVSGTTSVQKPKAVVSNTATTSKNSAVWSTGRTLKLDRRRHLSTVQFPSKFSSVDFTKTADGFIERRQKAVLRGSPVVTRYSIVRSKRKHATVKNQKANKVVVISGVPYKSSANKLTKAKSSFNGKQSKGKVIHSSSRKVGKLTKSVIIDGERFVMDCKGKSLQRISQAPGSGCKNVPGTSKQRSVPSTRRRLSGGRVLIRGPTTLIRSKLFDTQSKALASRALRRSIQNARLYKKNRLKSSSQQYCMFYNRFGKCNKKDTCPYIHDPSKVAVCTKFLRGRCRNTDGSCPFSHKIDRDKMPVCQFYLRGKCTNENCPYSHVNVSRKADVCEDFLKGFCSKGQQCTKKHILECEEFSQTGQCSKGRSCKLVHRTRKRTNVKRKSSVKEERNSEKQSRLDFISDGGFLPLTDNTDTGKQFRQDSTDDMSVETEDLKVEPVVIRPRLLKTKKPQE